MKLQYSFAIKQLTGTQKEVQSGPHPSYSWLVGKSSFVDHDVLLFLLNKSTLPIELKKMDTPPSSFQALMNQAVVTFWFGFHAHHV